MFLFKVQGDSSAHREAGEVCVWPPPSSTSLCASLSLFGTHCLGSIPMGLALIWEKSQKQKQILLSCLVTRRFHSLCFLVAGGRGGV